MKRQKDLIHEVLKKEEYVIVVLDACRYDFFSVVYQDFFDGYLSMVVSEGCNTPEWLVRTFPGKYDFTYISSNPFISLAQTPEMKAFMGEYKPWEHFKIVPVYDFGWDPVLMTVPPSAVYEAAISQGDRKMIVHFMQPHAPYIGRKKILRNEGEVLRLVQEGKITLFDVMEAYVENLKLVLKWARKLYDDLGISDFYITADHGELIRKDFIGHPPDCICPEIIMVPWLEINH